ncbi:MAG TPA: hypothetical protein VII11_11285 [Bacteroidota bacterium]
MEHDTSLEERWIRVGIVAGFVACISYPVMSFVSMPLMAVLTVGSAFGPSLGIASVGLYYFFRLERETVAGQIGAIANLLAGALVTAMILVQLAIEVPQLKHIEQFGKDESVQTMVRWIWKVDLGLDVAFDVFIGIGTFCFGLRMMKHPKFGALFGVVGMVIALVGLLGLNFYTFPNPPGESGFAAFEPGLYTGLWYLAVTIQMWRSLKWVRETGGQSQEMK